MKNHGLQNRELDKICRKLIASDSATIEEVEKIVSRPQLYDSVIARIKAEKMTRGRKSTFDSNAFRRHPKIAFSLGALLALAALTTFTAFKKLSFSDELSLREASLNGESLNSIAQISPPAQIEETMIETVRTSNSDLKTKIKSSKTKINAAVRRMKPEKTAQKPIAEKQIARSLINSNEFYPLALADAANDNEEMLIVRTELSKAALFALGVNVSLENDDEKIKADLLLSAGDIPRAIRLVGKGF